MTEMLGNSSRLNNPTETVFICAIDADKKKEISQKALLLYDTTSRTQGGSTLREILGILLNAKAKKDGFITLTESQLADLKTNYREIYEILVGTTDDLQQD